jgi:hypothetical protein
MLSKKRHVFEVAAGKPANIGKGIREISRQTLDHFSPPSIHLLALSDFHSDPMIQLHQLGIDGQGCTLPCLRNIDFELSQPVHIAFGQYGNRFFAHSLASYFLADTLPSAGPSPFLVNAVAQKYRKRPTAIPTAG